MRHPHADVIIAWANGAQIQVNMPSSLSSWLDSEHPSWDTRLLYRVKPEKVKYRLYLSSPPQQVKRIQCWQSTFEMTQQNVENFDTFIKWLSPEMEIELNV